VTTTEARELVLRLLGDIAPDADMAQVDGAVPLADQLDLDSMDQLNLLQAIAQETGRDVPDGDLPRLATLDGAAAYLAA
jgi:acyl carrier protein